MVHVTCSSDWRICNDIFPAKCMCAYSKTYLSRAQFTHINLRCSRSCFLQQFQTIWCCMLHWLSRNTSWKYCFFLELLKNLMRSGKNSSFQVINPKRLLGKTVSSNVFVPATKIISTCLFWVCDDMKLVGIARILHAKDLQSLIAA